MSSEATILLALALPLLASGLAALLSRRPNVREFFSLLSGVTLFGVIATLLALGSQSIYDLISISPSFDVSTSSSTSKIGGRLAGRGGRCLRLRCVLLGNLFF